VFKNKIKQYINILRQDNHLKIDNKILDNGSIINHQYSSFVIYDPNNIPQDAHLKLELLQKELSQTYLATLTESTNQTIVSVNEKDIVKYNYAFLTHELNVQIPKNEIKNTKAFYGNNNIDYILSPFQILINHIESSLLISSLNMLVYNNNIYFIITDQQRNIIDFGIKQISSIEDISKDDEFANDNGTLESVFNELHFLEIQQFLNDTISEFYQEFEDKEIGKIEILYAHKVMFPEQIEQLSDETMLDINYELVKLEEQIDTLVQSQDGKKYSFVEPAIKAKDNSIYLWTILAGLSFAIIFALVILLGNDDKAQPVKKEQKNLTKTVKNIDNKLDKLPVVKKEQKIKKEVPTTVLLLNHKEINRQIHQEISMLFDVVPYDAVLKELEIVSGGSTFVVNFVANSNSLADMQAKLKNIYKDTQLLLTHKNNAIVNNIVENSMMITTNIKNTNALSSYKKTKHLSIAQVTKYLEKICIKNSNIKFRSKQQGKYLTYNFTIKSTIKQPQDFFNFINNINKLERSINIAFPIKFTKTKQGLIVQYKLQYHQYAKELKLKK
jgi:hypothetical protein